MKKIHLSLEESDFPNPIKGTVRIPEQIYDTFGSIKDEAKELFLGVYLTDDLEAITYNIFSVDGQDVALVIPEDIFGLAYTLRSRYFILVRNHPKGNPKPSINDQEVIDMLQEQSKTMRRTMLDFIIIGDLQKQGEKNYWSWFNELGGGEYTLGGAFMK